MRAEIIRPQDLDQRLIERWRAIQASAPHYRSPFYAPEFTQIMGDTRKDSFVAILEQDGLIAGFFPFHLIGSGVGKPIGGPISDYQGPILDTFWTGASEDLLRLCHLSAYDFNHLPTDLRQLSGRAHARSRSLHVDLTAGYEAYAAEQPKTWLKAIKDKDRCIRKAEREIGPVHFTVHDREPETYRAHSRLKAALLARDKVSSILELHWVAETMERIRTTQSASFAGVMSTVRAGEHMIGSHFGMRSADVWHWWFPAYNLNFSSFGPGIMLIDAAARAAPDMGVRFIDFGRGESPYKQRFANGHTSLCEGSIERAATPAGALRKLHKQVLECTRTLPLGGEDSLPRRAFNRFVTGMRLPGA